MKISSKLIVATLLILSLMPIAFAECIVPTETSSILKSSANLCTGDYTLQQGYEFASANIVLDCQGATLRGKGDIDCIQIINKTNVTIANCRFVLCRNAIVVEQASDVVISGNQFYNNSAGIVVGFSKNVRTSNNEFLGSNMFDIYDNSNINFSVIESSTSDNSTIELISENNCVNSCKDGCAFVNGCVINQTGYEPVFYIVDETNSTKTIMFHSDLSADNLSGVINKAGVSKQEFDYGVSAASINSVAIVSSLKGTKYDIEINIKKNVSTGYLYIAIPAELSKVKITFPESVQNRVLRNGNIIQVYLGNLNSGQTKSITFNVDSASDARPYLFIGVINSSAKTASVIAVWIITCIYLLYLFMLINPVKEKSINIFYYNKIYKLFIEQKKTIQNALHALPVFVILYFLLGVHVQLIVGSILPAVLLWLVTILSLLSLGFLVSEIYAS